VKITCSKNSIANAKSQGNKEVGITVAVMAGIATEIREVAEAATSSVITIHIAEEINNEFIPN
jgi:hypothetical protein